MPLYTYEETLWRVHIAAVVKKMVHTEILPKQNPISQVPNPVVLQFLEVATPSSISDFDGIEGKTTQTPVGKREKKPPQVQIVVGWKSSSNPTLKKL
jgi:hypothetical protein